MRVRVISIAVMLLAGAASANEILVGEQPVSLSLGTEVSTNVPFNVSRRDIMTFMVEMEQNGVESNNVQVAFGRDLDEDGDLAPDESDLVLGWRRGGCFIEDLIAPEYLFKTNWNLLKVTRRGVESAAEWCLVTSSYRSFSIRIR